MTADLMVRLAGVSALLALPVLLLSGIFLALFFGGRGERFGGLNDFFSAIGLLLLAAPAAAVYLIARDATGEWLLIFTVAAIGGMALAAVGQFLLILRVIDLQTSFVTGGIGVVPVLAWVGVTVWLALSGHLLPEAVGWLGAATLASAALLTVAAVVRRDRAVWVLSAVLVAALGGWLITLGLALLGGDSRIL